MNNKKIGARIKGRRKELNLTLNDVANIVGVASSTIQRYESGTISQYKLPILESIAKAINVNPTWLVREDAPMDINIPLTTNIQRITKFNSNKKKSKEYDLVNIFNKLNDAGKDKVLCYTNDLIDNPKYTENNITELKPNKKEIWEEEGKGYLMPRAAHAIDGEFTEEEKAHDDNLMEDASIWD